MRVRISILCLFVFVASIAATADSWVFNQTNLVSDGFVAAAHIDTDLKNPWGISFAGASPFWIADNGTAKSTLYNGAGVKQGLIVNISVPGGGQAAPTGTVNN